MATQLSEAIAPVAQNKERDFPEVPDNVWSKVSGAAPFSTEFNEENLFRSMYYESAQNFYSQNVDTVEQGRAILKLFMRWEDVAAQFTRYVLSDDPDNPLDAVLSFDPEGAGEAYVRALRPDTFGSASYSITPTTAGQNGIIPDDGNTDTTAGNRETANQNTQAWMIFGWQELLAGSEVPYDYIQAEVNDNIGVRREEYLKNAMQGQDTLKVVERIRGPIFVEPGFDLDVDMNVTTTNIQTGIWPIGIEIIRADDGSFGGVHG